MRSDSLGKRFEIQREIGRGGMGTVYLAHDNHLGRRVAVKVFARDASQAIGADRFAREIRVTARLVHPSIVPLFDSGEVDDRLFFVMPFVDGPTLRAHIAGSRAIDINAVTLQPGAPVTTSAAAPPDAAGRLHMDETNNIVRDVAEALSYAHAQGVVHRDIKPENIFCYAGRAMLADFGIAKIVMEKLNDTFTMAGEILGTVLYISPEQALGEEVDARSDLYSLGCVWYEMLAGAPVFPGPTPMALLAQHIGAPVPSLKAILPDCPGYICDLITSMLAKDRNARPANAGVVLEKLRAPRVSRRVTKPVAVTAAAKYKPESMAAYAEGRNHWQRGMQGGAGAREKLETAEMYFHRAQKLDPTNPLALVGLSDTIHVLGYRGFRPYAEAEAEARALRMRALVADDELGELHTSIGVTLLYWDDDFENAGREIKLGRDLDPESVNSRRFYGAWLKIAGRLDEAVDELQIVVDLSPNVPAQQNALADALMAAGRFEEAIVHLRIALRLNPRYDVALERLEIACHRSGKVDEAINARRAFLGQHQQTERLAALDEDTARYGWAAARELDVRRELAAFLERATRENPFEDLGSSRQLADQIITSHAELGEWKSAMDWVERSAHNRPGRLRRVLTDFAFDRRGLAVDPRYAPLLRNSGLEELLEEGHS